MKCFSFATKCAALVALAVASSPVAYVEAGGPVCPDGPPATVTPAPTTVTPAPTTTTPAPTSTTPAPTSTTPAPKATTPAPTSSATVQTIVIYSQPNYNGNSLTVNGAVDTCYSVGGCDSSYPISSYKLKIPSGAYQDIVLYESIDCTGRKGSSNEALPSGENGEPNLKAGGLKLRSFVFRSANNAAIKKTLSICPQRRQLRQIALN